MPQFLLHKWGIMILAFVYEYLLELGLKSDSSNECTGSQNCVAAASVNVSMSKGYMKGD